MTRGDEPPALSEVTADLRSLLDRVDDLILELLRDAVDAGEHERPMLERRLSRARRALERALALLQGQPAEDLRD